ERRRDGTGGGDGEVAPAVVGGRKGSAAARGRNRAVDVGDKLRGDLRSRSDDAGVFLARDGAVWSLNRPRPVTAVASAGDRVAAGGGPAPAGANDGRIREQNLHPHDATRRTVVADTDEVVESSGNVDRQTSASRRAVRRPAIGAGNQPAGLDARQCRALIDRQ